MQNSGCPVILSVMTASLVREPKGLSHHRLRGLKETDILQTCFRYFSKTMHVSNNYNLLSLSTAEYYNFNHCYFKFFFPQFSLFSKNICSQIDGEDSNKCSWMLVFWVLTINKLGKNVQISKKKNAWKTHKTNSGEQEWAT